jgi:hypothetical protein
MMQILDGIDGVAEFSMTLRGVYTLVPSASQAKHQYDHEVHLPNVQSQR